MATVPLVNILDSLLQRAYHDLTVLQELLRHKSDGDRKAEIVKYARKTRSLLIRLLALVKWAGNSSSIQKCAEMSTMLSQQSGFYVDTADQLVHLVRSTLVHACSPNFSLAPAVDVLISGTYPRLPTCIKDRVVPLPPLTEGEEKDARRLLNCAIRHRLLAENIPVAMKVTAIGEGVISFKVPHEFEITLSVVSDDLSTPWRLVSLRILVGDVLPDKPVLLHEQQHLFMHQLLQSRLYAEENPMQDCYRILHSFCLYLQLDCLNSQAQHLCMEVYGGYMKVEDYLPGHHLRIVYWRPGTSQFMSAFLLDPSRTSAWPKVLISIDPSQPPSSSFSTQHFPPMPEGSEVTLSSSNISLEVLLKKCVSVRSLTLLKELQTILSGSCWEGSVELLQSPLCLRVTFPLKYGTRHVLLCVDPRVGNIVASVSPPSNVAGVQACLEELEKMVTSNWSSLSSQLLKLQCHMFVGMVCELAIEQGVPVHWSLPLVTPLPLHSLTRTPTVAAIYLELLPLVHLLVSVGEGLDDQYHLVSLSPTSLITPLHPTLPHTPEPPPHPTPKSFFAVSSLLSLDVEKLCLQHLRTIVAKKSGAILKRALKESDVELPCLKRLCIFRTPNFAPLPGLISTMMVLFTMETSLMATSISYQTRYSGQGCPSINISSFPLLDEGSRDVHQVLSSSLQSCHVTQSSSGYVCTMVLRPLESRGSTAAAGTGGHGRKGDHVILRQPIASDNCDLGQTLLGLWQAKLTLLGLVLELQGYLADPHWPLNSFCVISEFSYDQLTVSFGKHSLYLKTTPTGPALSLSPDCPHRLVQDSLEMFLRDTGSLPLLLQGVCASEEPLKLLLHFSERIPAMSVSATVPSQVQLAYDNFFITLSVQANSSIAITGIRLNKVPSTTILQTNPLTYLQAFLHSTLSDASLDSDEPNEDTLSQSHSTPQKMGLYPTPSPISFPRRVSWPGSVPSPHGISIPSIPPFPSLAIGLGMGQNDGFNISLSLDQLHQLFNVLPPRPVKTELCVAGCSLLESFLGSLALLFHATALASKQFQLVFLQCDRGTYTYRTDSFILSLSIEGAVLKGLLKPARDNVWSNGEVELLTDLFKREVVSPPFTVSGLLSFFTLLVLPLTVFKSCVQLLQHQQNPPNGMLWSFTLYLTIPPDADLSGIPFNTGGPAVIFGRNKLLLFLRFERNQDKKSFIFQLMYDPKSNVAYVARFQNMYRNSLHPPIDAILRKASSEFAAGQMPGHFSSSLYPAVLSLAQASLPL